MKTKLLLWLAVASLSTAAWVSEPEALTYSIPDILKVTFGDYLADNETTPVERPYMALTILVK